MKSMRFGLIFSAIAMLSLGVLATQSAVSADLRAPAFGTIDPGSGLWLPVPFADTAAAFGLSTDQREVSAADTEARIADLGPSERLIFIPARHSAREHRASGYRIAATEPEMIRAINADQSSALRRTKQLLESGVAPSTVGLAGVKPRECSTGTILRC